MIPTLTEKFRENLLNGTYKDKTYNWAVEVLFNNDCVLGAAVVVRVKQSKKSIIFECLTTTGCSVLYKKSSNVDIEYNLYDENNNLIMTYLENKNILAGDTLNFDVNPKLFEIS